MDSAHQANLSFTPSPPSPIQWVTKRDGRVVPFRQEKIAAAIFHAMESTGDGSRFVADELANAVVHFLSKNDATIAISRTLKTS